MWNGGEAANTFAKTPTLPPKQLNLFALAFKKQKQRIPRRETETELAQLALFMEKEPQRILTTTPA